MKRGDNMKQLFLLLICLSLIGCASLEPKYIGLSPSVNNNSAEAICEVVFAF